MKNAKNGKKIIYIIVLIVVAIASAAGVNFDELFGESPDTTVSGNNTSDSTLQVHFIDVGQGDSTLILCNGKSLLIDAGENGHETDVINYLRSQNIDKLDYIVATHQHSDHIGGLPEVLEEFGADNIIMPKLTKEQTPTNSTYTAFVNAVKASGATVISAKPGLTYSLSDATFEILGPVTDDCESLNSMSAVTKITYGETSFLVAGDAEKDEEKEILETGADLDCDVLRVGHHGSSTSSSKSFLDAVTPEMCVISCGEDNDYGHPHKEIKERLPKYTDEIYRTDILGDIVMISDGQTIDVRFENQ